MNAIKLNQQTFSSPALSALPKLSSPRTRIGLTVVAGLVLIVLTQLVLSILTDQGAYEMANLKAQRHELTTSSDILSVKWASIQRSFPW